MAGYSGQLIALDANTPTEVQQAAATADQAQTQSQLARATLPSEVALRQNQAQIAGAQAQGLGIANQSAALSLSQQQQLNAYRQHMISLQEAAASASQGSAGDTGPAPAVSGATPGASPLAATSPGGAPASPLAAALPAHSNLFDPRIEQVMQSIDPNDPNAASKFDARMKALASSVPGAAQFVGQGSAANLSNWRSQIGAHVAGAAGQPASPLAAMTATPDAGGGAPSVPQSLANAGGPAAPVSPLTGTVDQDLRKMAILDPEGTGKMIAMQGMMRYQQTGDISVLQRYAPDIYAKVAEAQKSLSEAQKTAITTQATTMGQQANAVLSLAAKLGADAPEVQSAYRATLTSAVQHGWMTPQAAQQRMNQGLTTGNQAELAYEATAAQTVTEALTTSGVAAANEAAAKAAHPEPTSQYIGVDAQGRPIYHNIHAAPGTPDTTGNLPVNAKPSASAATFEVKKSAYLQVHPNDEQGAIEFANGQRTLAPGEAAIAAQAAASRDKATAAVTGQPFDEKAAAAQYYTQFTTAGAAGPPGGAPAGPGATPAAPANPRYKWITPAQQAAANSISNPAAAQGTRGNPTLVSTPAMVARLPKNPDGTQPWFIGTDGVLRQRH